jgi:spermidine synthase
VTYHGAEVLGAQPTTSISYYGPGSGIHTAIRYFNERDTLPAVSVIGLGAGVMNVYCDSVSAISYKEINPAVLDFANDYFTYLELCPEKTEVIMADGRLALEVQAKTGDKQYDIIMMDAFTDDAIPVHLLTREAFTEAYLPLLNEGGIIAFHISNRYLNLYPPIVGNARSLGYEVVAVKAEEVFSPLMNASLWVLVTDAETATDLLQYPATYEYQSEEFVWTDSNNSIFEALDFNMSVSGITFSDAD